MLLAFSRLEKSWGGVDIPLFYVCLQCIYIVNMLIKSGIIPKYRGIFI